jgi:glycosyltransferase involved in cell wall biosynthesis
MVSAHYFPYVGGVETHVSQLVHHLVDRGLEVEVLTQNEGRSLPPVEEIDGVRVRRFDVPVRSANLPISPALARHLRREAASFDLVHAHQYHNVPALFAALSRPRCLVFTPHFHGDGHSPLRAALHRPYRVAGRMIFERSDRVICVSRSEAELVRRRFPSVAERIEVVRGGVDREALRAAVPLASDRMVVLTAGRLEAYKQVDRIVEAMALLGEGFELVVTGTGPARPQLEDLARRRGVDGAVRFVGRIPVAELHRWYRSAAVYVTMSTREAMGLSIVEALVAGAPVVCSDIEAHRDTADWSGGAIELVSPDVAPHSLATAIDTAARRPRVPVEIPDWGAVADRVQEIYEEAAAFANRRTAA